MSHWPAERHRAPALSPAQRERLLARYQAGESYQGLARELGLSDRRVRALLHAEGVMRDRWEWRRLRAGPRQPKAPRLPRPRLMTLSPREREVLAAMATGKTNREIGAALFMAYRTVKHHAKIIFQKLAVTNRVQAVLWWLKEEQPCDKQAG